VQAAEALITQGLSVYFDGKAFAGPKGAAQRPEVAVAVLVLNFLELLDNVTSYGW